MNKPPAQRPSEAELQATFNREQPHRPHWPSNYYTAMLDPLLAAVIRTLAAHPPPPYVPRVMFVTPQRHSMWRRGPGRAQRNLDGKMLAAGEKPDSDD